MIYLLFLLFSILYLFKLKHYRDINSNAIFLLYSIPIIILWFIIIGGQYNVGTDYFAYIDLFTEGDMYYFEYKGDLLFASFIRFCNSIGLIGQDILFLISFIWIIILLYIIREITGSRYAYLFLFVFIVYSSTLHNQMNGIRQYCAIYILTLGVCLLYAKKYSYSICLFVSMCFIHSSSIIITPFILIVYFLSSKITNNNCLYAIVAISILTGIFLPSDNIILLIPYFDQYSGYSDQIEMVSIGQKITKYIYIPLILYAIHLFPKMNLNKRKNIYFITGICAFSLKIALVSMTLIGRLGRYYEILSCIPIVFLLVYLTENKKHFIYQIVLLFLFSIYFVKVTYFATNEYTYNSVFFNN